jgi:hypothetical protein
MRKKEGRDGIRYSYRQIMASNRAAMDICLSLNIAVVLKKQFRVVKQNL